MVAELIELAALFHPGVVVIFHQNVVVRYDNLVRFCTIFFVAFMLLYKLSHQTIVIVPKR
jgi:hypothetical protein